MRQKYAVVLAAAGLFLGLQAQAAVVEFNFDNVSRGSPSAPPSSLDPGLVMLADFAGNPNIQPGLAASVLADPPQNNAFGGKGWISQGQYYSFEVQAKPGYALDLTGFSLNGISAPVDLSSWAIQVQIGSQPYTVPGNSPYPTTTGSGQSVSFSGSQFLNITAPVTIKLIEAPGTPSTSNNGNPWKIDNVSLNGSLAPVPEPAAYGVATLAVLGLLTWRSRSRPASKV